MEKSSASLVLVQRLAPGEGSGEQGDGRGDGLESGRGGDSAPLRLLLTADQRTSLRGHRRSACGRDLVLQLPRGAALQPGEWLSTASGDGLVRVEAAPEALLLVRSPDPLALLQAAYHLGNRHVAMELHPGELRILDDSVLADLLRQRGLELELVEAPFEPEAGAYAGGHSHSAGPSHSSGHTHSHRHGHDHGRHEGPDPVSAPSPEPQHDHHDQGQGHHHGPGHAHGSSQGPNQSPSGPLHQP
jgi:urease accessory protein